MINKMKKTSFWLRQDQIDSFREIHIKTRVPISVLVRDGLDAAIAAYKAKYGL